MITDDSPPPPRDGDVEAAEGTSLTAARGLLLAVPVLWATYNPALRFIYDSPTSPSPAELTSVRMLALRSRVFDLPFHHGPHDRCDELLGI